MKALVMPPLVESPRYTVFDQRPDIGDEKIYAFAEPRGSVALSSGSASVFADVLNELEELSWFSGDAGYKFAAQRFKDEICRPERDLDVIRRRWIAVRAAATINRDFGLVERTERLLQAMRLA